MKNLLIYSSIFSNLWKVFRLVIAIFFVFFVFVAVLGEISGIGSHIHQAVSEFPIVLLFFVVIYLSVYKDIGVFKKTTISIFFIFYLYFLYDLFYVMFGRYFLLVDLIDLASLLDIMPWNYVVFFLFVVGFPLAVFLWYAKFRAIFLGVFVLSIYFFLVLWPQQVVNYIKYLYPGVFYEHAIVMDNGRFASLLYFEAKRRVVLSDLQNTKENLTYQPHLPLKMDVRPDVIVIVLESYVDPNYFNSSYLSNVDKSFFFSASRSPVFAGGTARAEFEILCAVPSYGYYDSNEFNLINNRGLPCYPRLFSEQGYHTLALNPYKPTYFNAMRAYEGLGFDEAHFHPEYYYRESCIRHAYPKTGFYRNEWLFDDLLACMNGDRSTPFFSYVMTTYGHSPFELPDDMDNAYTNQGLDDDFSRALTMGKQVNGLLIDLNERLKNRNRDYILIVVGDHLPTFSNAQKNYDYYGYKYDIKRTPLAIYNNGKAIPVPEDIAHHQLIDYALCYVGNSDCAKKIQRSEVDLKQRYQFIMKKSVTPVE
jgi:phosphoglycerol transferase MdoB-like AlkP superfamily enzyme